MSSPNALHVHCKPTELLQIFGLYRFAVEIEGRAGLVPSDRDHERLLRAADAVYLECTN